jgi:hypothetical protein
MKKSVLEYMMESYSDVPDTTEPPSSSDSIKNEEKHTKRKKILREETGLGVHRIN